MPRKKKGESIEAWLGDGLLIEGGAMRYEGCLRVDGTIRDSHLHGENLLVGHGGAVSGRITIGTVEVFGDLDGRVEVTKEARIEPGGKFRGEMVLNGPSLIVEEGASFEGRARMAEPSED